MAIFNSAYDTLVCQGYKISSIADKLLKAAWSLDSNNNKVYLVRGTYYLESDIPSFAHPIVLTDKGIADQKSYHNEAKVVAALDVRWYGGVDKRTGEFELRNRVEYDLAVRRAELNYLWVKEGTGILRDISLLPMSMYASWISEAISKRFALDSQEQLNLSIYAALYYRSLFNNDQFRTADEATKNATAATVSKALHCSIEPVLNMISEHFADEEGVPMDGIKNFCEHAGRVVGTVRLKEFSEGLLIAIINNTWLNSSTNAKEVISVALEHPPTWMAIVYAACQERTYKNSPISKIAERRSNKELVAMYARSVQRLEEFFKVETHNNPFGTY